MSEHGGTATVAVMQVQILRNAPKDLETIDRADRNRTVANIEQYAADPASKANDVKSLQGSDLYRLRVADYRVLFTIEAVVVTVMVVHRVRHRREAHD